MDSRHEFKSGGMKRLRDEDDDDPRDYEESITHLIVHHKLPPFLVGKVSSSKVSCPVLPVRDPTCDMAVNAMKGSALVKRMREEREKKKAQKKEWNLKNTQIGEILNVKPKDDGETANVSAEGGYRDKYSKYMDKVQTERSKILSQRKKLPVYACRSEILQLIDENPILIIVGETGSGKTTQLTQFLYEEQYWQEGCIACTQPRRVAAVSVAQRVANEMGVELGKEVGYSIRFEDKTSEKTKIKYMTDGVLLRESLSDPELYKYSCVIMDEAHERSLNTDILFGLLRDIATKRNSFKLIVTSATMEATKFANFFGGAQIYKVPGRTFEVEKIFALNVVQDYVEQAINKAIDIHLKETRGDILIFMPGQEEIEVCCDKIGERLDYLKSLESSGDEDGVDKRKIARVSELIILPMYSSLPPEKQALVFREAPEGARKCVVATNIAETSLTVDGIRYVIDSGYGRLKVFQPKMGIDALLVYPISVANANQRAGRAGRTSRGFCYRLYTENQYKNELLVSSVPEIQRSNLSNIILLLKSLQVDLNTFKFMDPPPQENIDNSMHQLWMLGALDNHGKLTELGRRMANFPLEPTMSKMVVESIEDGCSNEVIIIVAMLSGPTVFYRPEGREEDSDRERERFYIYESDHLTLLNVYKQWEANKDSQKFNWCSIRFVNHKVMIKVRDIVDQLKHIMKTRNYKIRSTTDENVIKRCICKSYFHQAAKLKNLKEYDNIRTGTPCQLHPTSALYNMGALPKYVIYHELIMTTKEYMHCATAVEANWLADLGPMFYSLKRR